MNSVRRVKRQYNGHLEIEGVLLTMYDGRLNLTQQVVEEVKNIFRARSSARLFPAVCAFRRPQASASRSAILTAIAGVRSLTTSLRPSLPAANKF